MGCFIIIVLDSSNSATTAKPEPDPVATGTNMGSIAVPPEPNFHTRNAT
jgi:hypothetical protein